jgi:uncharacterized membrane protein YkvI
MVKKKVVIPATIGVAAVWFGSHAGGGFATGRQEVEFFVQFGWHAIWIGLLSMFILGTAIFFGLEFARMYKVHDYKSLFKQLYAPYNKMLPVLWEVLYLYGTILGAGVAIAAASHLISGDTHLVSGDSHLIYKLQILEVPYGVAVVFVGIILLLLTIFGSKLVRNASTFMSIFIILALLAVTILGINFGFNDLKKIVSEKTVKEGTGFIKILWMALLYGAFQSILIAPIVSVSETLKTRKSCFKAAFFGFLVNGAMLIMVCIMLVSFFFKGIYKQPLPVDFVTCELGFPILCDMYALILFFALISTGVGLIFGVIKRFENAWKTDKGLFKSIRVKRMTICLSCLIISGGISLFGLAAIVKVGYGSLGLFAIFLNIIPLLFVAPIKIKRAKNLGRGN